MIESSTGAKLTGLHCPECDYDLTGAPGHRCPWCGWEIDSDALSTGLSARRATRTLGLGLVSLVVGLVSLTGVATMMRRANDLTLLDGLAFLGVLIAALGHLVLAAFLIWTNPHRPSRYRELGRLLLFVGVTAVLLGAVAAASAFEAVPMQRLVRGVVVNGVFEYCLYAFLFTLPGWALLLLRFVAFHLCLPGTKSKRLSVEQAETDEAYAPFEVVAASMYALDQVTQSVTNSPRPTTAPIEAAIARTWDTETALAGRNQRLLYNGQLARLIGWRAGDTSLNLSFGPTTYRDFFGTNLHNADLVRQEGADYFADPLGISMLVVTSDGFLLLGRRSQHVSYHAGFLHTIGGLLEAVDLSPAGHYDVFGCALRELREELGVPEGDVERLVVTGIVRDRAIHQPELIFDARLGISRAMCVARFDPAHGEREHTKLEWVHDDPEQIGPFINRSLSVAPVAQASLLLHGRHAWGLSWYEQTCFLLYGELPAVASNSKRP